MLLPGAHVGERLRPTGGLPAAAARALGRVAALASKQVPDAQQGAARRDQVAPDADHLLDRLQRAAEQDGGREHCADGRQPLDDQIGAEPEDQRLHRQPQELDQALHGRGAVAGR